jgi:N-acetylneuraminic acid mutarotase
MVYNSSDTEMLLFGGLDSTTTSTVVYGDTWKMKNNVWTKIRDMGPGLLYGVDIVYTGKRAVLFGGSDGIAISHNTWDWRGTLWTQRQNMGPPGRGLHSMVYDNDRKIIVLFSGVDESRDFNDTWEHTKKEST